MAVPAAGGVLARLLSKYAVPPETVKSSTYTEESRVAELKVIVMDLLALLGAIR